MTETEISDYNESVRSCLAVLGKARPSEGIISCSRDCKNATEQIKTSPAPSRDDGQSS
jgi:hypothetical protein